ELGDGVPCLEVVAGVFPFACLYDPASDASAAQRAGHLVGMLVAVFVSVSDDHDLARSSQLGGVFWEPGPRAVRVASGDDPRLLEGVDVPFTLGHVDHPTGRDGLAHAREAIEHTAKACDVVDPLARLLRVGAADAEALSGLAHHLEQQAAVLVD